MHTEPNNFSTAKNDAPGPLLQESEHEENPPSADARTQYRVEFGDTHLNYRPVVIDEPVVTGRELIEASSNGPIDDFIILQVLPSGDLSELRLDQKTDLRAAGTERFIVVKSDHTFRLVIGDERQEWPVALIDGLTIKRLGKKEGEEVAVFLKRHDGMDQEIADHDVVDLSAEGVEQLYFRPIEQIVQISVNEQPVHISRGKHTGLQIKESAIAQGVRISVDFVLSLHEAGGHTKIIGDQDPVKVHSGQCYTAVADDDVS